MNKLLTILVCALALVLVLFTGVVKAEEEKPYFTQGFIPVLCFNPNLVKKDFGEEPIVFVGDVHTATFPSSVISYIKEGVVHVFLTDPKTGNQCLLYTIKKNEL